MSNFEEPKRYTAINNTTGDLIKSRTDAQDKYAAGWDLIFNAKRVKEVSVATFNAIADDIDNEQ